MALVMFLVLGAAAPAPVQRNQWTTNVAGVFVRGDAGFTNTSGINGWITITSDGLRAFNKGGLEIVHLFTDNNLSAAEFGAGFAAIFTNGAASFTMKDSTQVGLSVFGATGQSVDLLRVGNSVGGILAAIHQTGGIYSSVLSSNSAVFTDNSTNLVSATVTAISYAANTNTVNFGAATLPYFTTFLTNDTVFTNRNQSAGKAVTLKMRGGNTNCALTFPAGWIFLGSGAPSTLTSNKEAILSLTAFGGDVTNIIAAYAVQP